VLHRRHVVSGGIAGHIHLADVGVAARPGAAAAGWWRAVGADVVAGVGLAPACCTARAAIDASTSSASTAGVAAALELPGPRGPRAAAHVFDPAARCFAAN